MGSSIFGRTSSTFPLIMYDGREGVTVGNIVGNSNTREEREDGHDKGEDCEIDDTEEEEEEKGEDKEVERDDEESDDCSEEIDVNF